MKLSEIPPNTLVELQFDYMGFDYKINVGLLYKNANSVYISAIKNAGKTIPASKLKNVALVYKTDVGLYSFKDVTLSSLSCDGQNLYLVQTEYEFTNGKGFFYGCKFEEPNGTIGKYVAKQLAETNKKTK